MSAPFPADISLFEGFRLDRRNGVLSRRDRHGRFAPTAVGSRAIAILLVLVERAGDVVARAEIMAAVWPATAVEDSNLNVQIAALRRVLDEGRTEGSCIQTVAGRGYRFVAPVTPAVASPTPSFGTATGAPIAEAAPRSRPPRRPWRSAAAAVIGAAVFLGAAAGWNWRALRPGEAVPAPRLSIIVLPFANLSDDRAQQYFADGVTEDLTTDLSRIAGSFVISHNTAATYGDKPVDAKRIGREVGVRYVLEGSVQREGTQVRVNAQLIDAETDAHLWAERFDRDMGDLFKLQNQITGRIAIALNLALIRAEASRATENPDALDYMFRGRAALVKPHTRDSYAEAIGLFEHALSLDPQSAEAQSLLANALASRVLDDMGDSPAADIERAEGLIGRALAALPRNSIAHFAKAQLLRAEHRCDAAIPEYGTVLAGNRNWVGAIANIGRCKIYLGLLDAAIPLEEEAIRLSPHDSNLALWHFRIGQARLLQSRIDEAVLALEMARAGDPGYASFRSWLAAAYGLRGDTRRAAAELAEARRLSAHGWPSSIARERRGNAKDFAAPTTRALLETTYLVGLRKAGVPEE